MQRQSRPFRVLVLAPFPPRLDAAYGGGRAVGQLVLSLAAHYQVALLCLRSPADRPTDPRLVQACQRVEEIPCSVEIGSARLRWKRRLRLALGWLQGRPMWVTDTRARAFGHRARTLAREWRPDIIQVEFHVMAQYLAWLRDCPAPRVLTEHDPGGRREEWGEPPASWATRLAQQLETGAWRRFTQLALSQVQTAVVFTERDRQVTQSLAPSTPVVRIPLAIASIGRRLNPRGVDPPSVLFVGSFTHPPNVDAALRLMRDIFPAVLASSPNAKLTLVGDQPTSEMLAGASAAVSVTGRVADVTAYLDQASVVVVPVRLGGGMRVKVLEALSGGKALVASPRALAGLEVQDGEHVLVAETDQEFTRAIVRLLHHPLERDQLATRAFGWASTNLAPDRSFQAYAALYRSLLTRG